MCLFVQVLLEGYCKFLFHRSHLCCHHHTLLAPLHPVHPRLLVISQPLSSSLSLPPPPRCPLSEAWTLTCSEGTAGEHSWGGARSRAAGFPPPRETAHQSEPSQQKVMFLHCNSLFTLWAIYKRQFSTNKTEQPCAFERCLLRKQACQLRKLANIDFFGCKHLIWYTSLDFSWLMRYFGHEKKLFLASTKCTESYLHVQNLVWTVGATSIFSKGQK